MDVCGKYRPRSVMEFLRGDGVNLVCNQIEVNCVVLGVVEIRPVCHRHTNHSARKRSDVVKL